VLKRYDVKVLLYSLPSSTSELSHELIKVATEKNVQVVKISKPMIVKTSDGLIIKILFPVSDMDREIAGNKMAEVLGNDASIVTQFIFGENKILLTGDLPQTGEKFLVQKYGEDLQSNILKLGHHGSDSSSNPEFLQYVKPQVAIVSAGENNSFGHPHRSVVGLVEKFGIKLLQTSEEGTITFRSNGINFWRE
jgi:competence protein ComEC